MIQIEKIDQAIITFYKEKGTAISEKLIESILYSVRSGGKRIRPLLFLQVLEGFGIELKEAHYQVAGALEMIHTGSLIHDDLPAMDDDDYRRGRLTNHKQFDEATAILAGDSLFLDAFALVAMADLPAEVIRETVGQLSLASGTFGMVGGQMLDMTSEGQQLELADLMQIHENKTGRLLAYPFYIAGIIAGQSETVIRSLKTLGMLVGHAFQVRDDILDITADFHSLGKTPQKDIEAEKVTYPSLLGLDKSRAILHDSLEEALVICSELAASSGFEKEAVCKIIESLRINE